MSLTIHIPTLEAIDQQDDSPCGNSDLYSTSYIPPAPPLPIDGNFRVKPRISLDSGRGSSNSGEDDTSEYTSSSGTPETITDVEIIPRPIHPLEPTFPLPLHELTIRLGRDVSFESDISLEDLVQRFHYNPKSQYQRVSGECIVCFEPGPSQLKLSCCTGVVCSTCLGTTIQTRLEEGIIEMPCPNPQCGEYIPRSEVILHLNAEEKERFDRLMVNAESDGRRKTCPHCSHITEHTLPRRNPLLRLKNLSEEDVKIVCEKCRIEWCFQCHAPWHRDTTCKNFMRGNKLFQHWTQGRRNGVANCQKCPTCRVFIQRSTGCDHMTCNRCRTHFCYKCGGRFLNIPGLGDHYSRTSILGCKYNYYPDRPARRMALRGGHFGAKITWLMGYPILFIGGVAVLVVVGAVALPIYGAYKLYKFKRNTRKIRRRRKH